ncbi:MAG: addiction module toxin RelE [Ignavibacteria bacterium CG08_land_8_20_14_0_20_37_9]|nr:MAG: addiction module toxin RelE [Ignavibacteria bacterium CG08_land_8_20_14_0_20_37_9]
MTFSFNLSDELKSTLLVLAKKDKPLADAINKKIRQIIDSDAIDHYKNLRHDLNNYKRVHIRKSFVLLFKVNKKDNHILFDRFGYHDDIYT